MNACVKCISEMRATMLELSGIGAYYGDSQALFDIDLSVDRGQVMSVIGRNGAGKTTTLRSIMGLTTIK
jgi:branched-chain amino acid transport system ATP-binding protein